jgi:DNA-binding transcriptional LysR family regulator
MDSGPADLKAIAIFVNVVEHRSFRAASATLGIPKSTVSLKIAQLEDQLGVRLLERTTRTLRLTDAGTTYYRQTAPALDALREAATRVAALQTRPTGRLRLTTTLEFGQNVLPEVLDAYLRRYPEVEIQIELGDRRVDLIEEGFDLAIRAGVLQDSTLIARALPTRAFRIYASPAYLRRCGEPRQPEQLRDHDCLLMTGHQAPGTWRFRRGRRAITVEVHGKIAVNSLALVAALAAAGHGIARLPEQIGNAAVAAGKLRRILDHLTPEAIPWHAVYPSARNLSPKVRAFLDLLEGQLRSAPPSHSRATTGVRGSREPTRDRGRPTRL